MTWILSIATGVAALLAGLLVLGLAGTYRKKEVVVVGAGIVALDTGLYLAWVVVPNSALGAKVMNPQDLVPILPFAASLGAVLAMTAVFALGLWSSQRRE